MRSRQRGFTLIELLVVIAIIAILAAILFPVFAQAREQARMSSCLSNLKQLGMGITMYRSDWDSRGPFTGWPPSFSGQFNVHSPNSVYDQDWQISIQPYLKNALVLHCPSDKTPYDERPVSYLYNPYMAINRVPAPEATFENAARSTSPTAPAIPTRSAPSRSTMPSHASRPWRPRSGNAPGRGRSSNRIGLETA